MSRKLQAAVLGCVLLAAGGARAQATAGFPSEGAKPSPTAAPPPPPPPRYPAPQQYAPQQYAPQQYAPQQYAPQQYAPQQYAPQQYAPQQYAPQQYAPQQYAPQQYAPQQYAPQQYAPQQYPPQQYPPYPGWVPPPAPTPPPDPLLDEQRRYRQVLGAYQRSDAPPKVASRSSYVSVAEVSRRHHDGLYFRFALGVGMGHDAMESDRALPTQRTLDFVPGRLNGSSGTFATATTLAIGFTPGGRGLVLGVAAYTVTLSKLQADVGDERTGRYLYRVSQQALFGPFVDWYFDPGQGFHVQVSPALATYVAGAAHPELDGPQAQAHTALGFGTMLGIGYEWWVGDQWSLGLLGRFTCGATTGKDDRGVGWAHVTYAPSLLLGATYH